MTAGILLIAFSGIGLLRPLENVTYVILSPIEQILRSIALPIANTVSNYGDTRSLTRENEALRTENERLNGELASLREGQVQSEELERLLEVKNSLADQEFKAARIAARSPNNLREMIAIDLGKSDGVKPGMPVVTEGKTLVGTISEVNDDYSWVKLVTDVDSAVSSLTLESRAQGVVSGGYNRRLTMEFVTQESSVKEGDTVLTSGLGGSYPQGLVIGRITGITGNPQEVFRQVTVQPLASLSRLENVLVMTSFVPSKITLP
ncbi:MAG: rod shape-determining protein MreC [Dehalococcoidia bacterium]